MVPGAALPARALLMHIDGKDPKELVISREVMY